ncbi:uncharacterized protein LOC126910022 [Daktulosphaira vitifoliae]|uniref:uncharacterized protein LOC126910022 n=1 Tax=Daktulosphaira vitifoliae TaxID=58002 RepID=UPI0021AAC789|nr:uncharacterized protein LOC126910022 [Daktulosphaira vitifoliae]
MLFLYIYSFTFICVINCNISINEKIKNLNSLVSNPNWLKFNNVILPTEHIDGECRKIPFSELFSKTNGAVFTNENYSIKMKRFHTMLSCSFALGLDHVAKLMHDLWNYCYRISKPEEKCSSEKRCSSEESDDGSSEEFNVTEYCNNKKINCLDPSGPALIRQILSYFILSADTEEEACILPALDIMAQFANNTFLTDSSIDEKMSKMKTILADFINNNCWVNVNNTFSKSIIFYEIFETNNCENNTTNVQAKELVRLKKYFMKINEEFNFEKFIKIQP